MGGIIAAYFAWFQSGLLGRLLVSLTCGFGTYLLCLNFFRTFPYEGTETYEALQVWNRMGQGGAIALGTVTTLSITLMLQRSSYRLPKLIASAISAIGAIAFASYLSLFTLLRLGYAD